MLTSPNPTQTFWHGIFDQLGVPWVPYTINVKQIQARKYIDLYSEADTAVQQALGADTGTNNIGALAGYSGFLPLEGYNVTKPIIQQIIAAANAQGQPAIDLLNLPTAPKVPVFYGAPPPQLPTSSNGS